METKKAIEIIQQACEKFVGTKQDHILIEQAIIHIKEKLQNDLLSTEPDSKSN